MKKLMLALLSGVVLLTAKPRPVWENKSPQDWSASEAEQILFDSPWSQTAEAVFPDPRDHDPIPADALPGAGEAGLKNTRGVSDGRWDGGVGMNHGAGLPSLQVRVRWESAMVVRQARERLLSLVGETAIRSVPSVDSKSEDYVISVAGLIPGAADKTKARLQTKSVTDDGPPTPEAEAEKVLENFMENSYLRLRSGALLRPKNADVDNGIGLVRLFFPRSTTINVKDKEALFSTRYGSLTVRKRFRLSELTCRGKLEL